MSKKGLRTIGTHPKTGMTLVAIERMPESSRGDESITLHGKQVQIHHPLRHVGCIERIRVEQAVMEHPRGELVVGELAILFYFCTQKSREYDRTGIRPQAKHFACGYVSCNKCGLVMRPKNTLEDNSPDVLYFCPLCYKQVQRLLANSQSKTA